MSMRSSSAIPSREHYVQEKMSQPGGGDYIGQRVNQDDVSRDSGYFSWLLRKNNHDGAFLTARRAAEFRLTGYLSPLADFDEHGNYYEPTGLEYWMPMMMAASITVLGLTAVYRYFDLGITIPNVVVEILRDVTQLMTEIPNTKKASKNAPLHIASLMQKWPSWMDQDE